MNEPSLASFALTIEVANWHVTSATTARRSHQQRGHEDMQFPYLHRCRALAEAAGSKYLAAIASGLLRRAARRALRELVDLDDCTLAELGLTRAEVTSLLEAHAET